MSSCLIQFVGIHNDYDLLSQQEKERIKKLKSFNDVKKQFIYEINAKQLLKELYTHKKSLVYIFTNGCKSENCLPISNIERFAENNDYKLFLIMNGYYNLDKTTSQQFNNPLFSINSGYYGSTKKKEYLTDFRKELGYYDVAKDDKFPYSYMFFAKDSLIEIKDQLNNAHNNK